MKLKFLILGILVSFAVSVQAQYQRIKGKYNYVDSLRFSKYKNNLAGDSVLTTDTSGTLKLVLNGSGGGGSQDLQSVTGFGNTTTNDIIVAPGFGSQNDINGSGFAFTQTSGSYVGTLNYNTLTGNRTWSLPNASGTIARTADIPGTPTLQAVTDIGNTTTTDINAANSTVILSQAGGAGIGEVRVNDGFGGFSRLRSNWLNFSDGANYLMINAPTFTGLDRTINFPNADGTIALTTDIPAAITVGTINSQTKSTNGAVITGSSLVMQTADASSPGLATSNQIIERTGVNVDGMGSTITTGSKGFVVIPYNATITNWYVNSTVSGSVVFDVKRSGTSIIGAGNKPTLTAATSATAAVSGWTSTTVTAGDILEYVVDSATTLSLVNLTIKLVKN